MTEQTIMTVEKFDKLRRRDFENGATIEAIRARLKLLERLEAALDKFEEGKSDEQNKQGLIETI